MATASAGKCVNEFSFAFNLRKQSVADFPFITLTQNCAVPKFLHIVSMVGYLTMVPYQFPLPLPRLLLNI